MSKLTGWIETSDSLDVQKIVENYEKELAENKTISATNNETKFLVGDEVWSGALDDTFSYKQPKKDETVKQPTEKLEAQEIKKDKVEPSTNMNFNFNKPLNNNTNSNPTTNLSKEEKTIKLDGFDKGPELTASVKAKTVNFDFIGEPKKPEIKKDNDIEFNNILNSKTVRFDTIIDNPIIDEKEKTINLEIKAKEEISEEERIRRIKDQKVFEVNNAINNNAKNNQTIVQEENKPFNSKTVLFDSLISNEPEVTSNKKQNTLNFFASADTKLISEENKTKKENTIQFVNLDNNQQQSHRFEMKENFEKILEANDYKTIRFESTSNNLNNENQRFTKCLDDMCFNETISVKDLDLTKEINDADVITVNLDGKKKKKSWFFSKRKNK